MEPRVWVNRHQPQTLYIAQMLLYLRGGFALLFGVVLGASLSVLALLTGAVEIGGAYGIANERRWGYRLGVAVAVVEMVSSALIFVGNLALSGRMVSRGLGLLFTAALVALLLHPMSRSYQRHWPKRQRR